MERQRIEGLPKLFQYPLLSQERIKLRTLNLASIFTGSIRTKALYIYLAVFTQNVYGTEWPFMC